MSGELDNGPRYWAKKDDEPQSGTLSRVYARVDNEWNRRALSRLSLIIPGQKPEPDPLYQMLLWQKETLVAIMDAKQREIDQKAGIKPEDHKYADEFDPRDWIPKGAAVIERYDPTVEHMPIDEALTRLHEQLDAAAQGPAVEQIVEFAADLRSKLQEEGSFRPESVPSQGTAAQVVFDHGKSDDQS